MYEYNDEFFELQADVCRILANPKRLKILNVLGVGKATVGELVEKTGFPQTNISQHLAILRHANIVLAEKDGRNIYYSVSNPKIGQACGIMREVMKERFKQNEKVAKRIIVR